MKTLWFHIGTPKTGTSALQRFFNMNRGKLLVRGLTYPKFGLVGNCHHRIGASFYPPENRPVYIQYDNTDTLEGYAHRLTQIEGDVLISSELASWGFFGPRLREVLPDSDIRPIVYLRRQDQYLMSRYNQDIKALYSGTVEEYAAEAGPLDYKATILQGWSEACGQENIVVRPYEKAQFHRGSLFEDFFFSVFDEQVPPDFQIPHREENTRLSQDAIEFKRLINNLSISDQSKWALSPTMQRYSVQADASSAQAFVGHSSLPAELRKEIQSTYHTSNHWIARTYLNRPKGDLFYENVSIDIEDEQPYEGLTTARIGEISAFIASDAPKIWNEIQSTIEQLCASPDNKCHLAATQLQTGLNSSSTRPSQKNKP